MQKINELESTNYHECLWNVPSNRQAKKMLSTDYCYHFSRVRRSEFGELWCTNEKVIDAHFDPL